MKNVRTKQQFSLSAVALAAVLIASGLVACSKGENERSLNPDDSRVINLSASVQATTNTKAAVVGATFPATTDNVFRLTAFSGAAAPADWSVTPYFNDIQVNSGAASALALRTPQYYPANGDKVYFYGYAPQATSLTAGTSATAPIAAYTITGQEDIMAAQHTAGIAAATTGIQPQPALAFTHKLMQVRFKVVADASFETGKKVTEVLVKNVKSSAKLDIGDGTLTFDGAANHTLSLPITAGTKDEITAGGTEMDGCVMLEPVGTGGDVTLKVTAGGVVYDNINVTLAGVNAGAAGTSHLITMTFKRGEIIPTAAISDWVDVGGSSVDVGVMAAIGDFRNGGIVYHVTDAKHYKVVSLTEAPTILKWTANRTYVIGAGAQSYTDSKGNAAAIKAYYEANKGVAVTESTFEDAFPATAHCYNYQGENGTDAKGSWYLPAVTDLQYLWCAYNDVAPISWESGEDASAPAYIPAQRNFNKYLTDAGGAEITPKSPFWSSTENNLIPNKARYIYFINGNTLASFKNDGAFVRCVKNITPPTVGDFRDGGIVYQVTDAKNYKIFSLGQGASLKWSAQDTYVLGAAGQSDNDGEANVVAMKAYSANTATHSTTGVFATDFPAAEFCEAMNTGGVTGWYLPSEKEMLALVTIVNNKFTIYDPVISANGGTLFEPNERYWTSSESSNTPSSAFHIHNSVNISGYRSKSDEYYVRCIKKP